MGARSCAFALPAAVVLVTLTTAAAPTSAHADPFRVLSGGLAFDTGDPPTFHITGPDFTAVALVTFGPWEGYDTLVACNFSCPSGTVLGVDFLLGGPAEEGGRPFGVGLLRQSLDDEEGKRVGFEGFVTFDAEPVTLAGEGGPEGFAVFTPPITVTGRVAVYDEFGEQLFEVPIAGTGNARLVTRHDPAADTYSFSAMSYTFDTSAVVPEPGTLLLLGGGLALAFARRRRQISTR